MIRKKLLRELFVKRITLEIIFFGKNFISASWKYSLSCMNIFPAAGNYFFRVLDYFQPSEIIF